MIRLRCITVVGGTSLRRKPIQLASLIPHPKEGGDAVLQEQTGSGHRDTVTQQSRDPLIPVYNENEIDDARI